MKKVIIIAAALIVIAGAVVFFGLPMAQQSRARAMQAHCGSNLRQIGMVVEYHKSENGDLAPASLQVLSPIMEKADAFICKCSGTQPGSMDKINEWTSYKYIAEVQANGVRAYCPIENHNGTGGNVLFVDGAVRWYPAEEFAKIIK